MGDSIGFLKTKRSKAAYRPVTERVKDFCDVCLVRKDTVSQEQASRCMDCGTPFCHWGCPLANVIPEWNDLMFHGEWKKAVELLQSVNNFPEITARICPALCEYACVLGINDEPVTIRENELAIMEYAFEKRIIKPNPPAKRTKNKIAVIGGGPAGLACADILNKKGHIVTVFEKDDKIGGILRYGIPDFKLEKRIIDRRLKILEEEGIVFKVNQEINMIDPLTRASHALSPIGGEERKKYFLSPSGRGRGEGGFDAVCLAIGSREPRRLDAEGRGLNGIYFAMDYLVRSNKSNKSPSIDAKGKHVVVIGGGDTGSDCVGTANRQGAISVTQVEILPKPPLSRTEKMPWPMYPSILKTSTSHEEGCNRIWSAKTKKFIGVDNNVRQILCEAEGKEFVINADLVILAMGFVHPVRTGLLDKLNVELDSRGNIKTNSNYMTSIKGIFSAGDCHKGASLVVWAIKEGRETAEGIDEYFK